MRGRTGRVLAALGKIAFDGLSADHERRVCSLICRPEWARKMNGPRMYRARNQGSALASTERARVVRASVRGRTGFADCQVMTRENVGKEGRASSARCS